jgi:hypothetical protein
MRVLKNENVFPVDVDQTLVLWGKNVSNLAPEDLVQVRNPYTGKMHTLQRHIPNIQILICKKKRGFHIRVHSANGYKWANAVITALGLEAFVDDVETKPNGYLDDKPAEHWIGPQIYLDENDPWGR